MSRGALVPAVPALGAVGLALSAPARAPTVSAPIVGSRIVYDGCAGVVIRLEHVMGAGWTRAVIQLDGQPPARAFSVERDDLELR